MYWQIQDLLVFHQFYTSTLLSDNGQRIGRVLAAIATEISADSRSICRPSLGWHLGWCIRQYVDRYMVVISAESWSIYSADICWPKTVECQSICWLIYISRGVHKIHSHDPKRDLTSSAQTLLIGETKSNHHSQIKSNQIRCWLLGRGENQSTRRKTSRSRVENQQTQPTIIWCQVWVLNLGHIGGRRELLPHYHPAPQKKKGEVVRALWICALQGIHVVHIFGYGFSMQLHNKKLYDLINCVSLGQSCASAGIQ